MTATDGGSPTTDRGAGGRPLGSAYVVHETIGRGATGEVWRGADRRTGAPVAVKILRPELADDPSVVERFLRERSILSELDAPNIVRLRDLVVEGDTVALVTDLVTGGDLRARLQRDGPLPPALAVDLVCQVLEGLDVAHQRGVIHRDLKPENVLVEDGDDGPVVRITDFGIATLAFSTSLAHSTSIVGSPEYLAPEVIELGAHTPAVDLYSAGIVLYELLAGRTPFAGGPPIAVVRRQVDDPPPRISGVPVSLWSEIAALLAKDPSRRPPRAHAAARRLAELSDELVGLPALAPGAVDGVVDIVAAEAIEADEARNGNGRREPPERSEHETTRVRGRRVVDEAVLSAAPVQHPARRRAWQRVAPFVAGGVVLAGMGAVWIARRADSSHAASVRFVAAPVAENTGAVVTRTLALSGTKGDHLAVRMRIRNAGRKTIDKVFEPVLGTTSGSESVHHVRLVSGDTTTVSYTATVPHGDVDVARLATIEAQLDRSVTNGLALAHATPGMVRLRPQERAYINLSGATTKPSAAGALDALLTAIDWHSSDASVADVEESTSGDWRPVVVASHPGRAVLHADVGLQSLDVEVLVSGKAAVATDPPCEPGVGDPPGMTTIADGTTIVDPADHAYMVAGGARFPITDGASASGPVQDLDQTEVGAIPTIPRDGTVFAVSDTNRDFIVAGGSIVQITPPEVAARHAAAVRVHQGWLYLVATYPYNNPRDGTLVTDFARKTTMLRHDDAWTAATHVCPAANVAWLPRNAAVPQPSTS